MSNTTTMTTIASSIASVFGTAWERDLSEGYSAIHDVCRSKGGKVTRLWGARRYTFADGSAVLIGHHDRAQEGDVVLENGYAYGKGV